MDLEYIEYQLQQRLQEPFIPWGRKQTNDWDAKTKFIYQTDSWSDFKIQTEGMSDKLYAYAINRWFNFWSAVGIEKIFCSLDGVEAAVEKDRLKDFYIQGIPFDHKTTVYPKAFEGGETLDLINWLYDNQSPRSKRLAYNNRLFLVLYDLNGEHWRLRADLTKIRLNITRYINNFKPENLYKLNVRGNDILSDVIWYVGWQ